jgi:hypothetical protein
MRRFEQSQVRERHLSRSSEWTYTMEVFRKLLPKEDANTCKFNQL